MSYIKYDDDLCNSVKGEMTTLQSDIRTSFESIGNSAKNAKISLDDPKVVVISEVVKKPNFIAGIFGAKEEIVREEVANYSANASIYNDNLDLLSKKALEVKNEVNEEIKKVINALEAISVKVNEFEDSPLTELNKFEVEYEESSYGFLYGYASVGSDPDTSEEEPFIPEEVPIGAGGGADIGEDDDSSITNKPSGNDGTKKNNEDDDVIVGAHIGSNGEDKDSSDDDEVITSGHDGNDGNSEDNSINDNNNLVIHSGSNGNRNDTTNDNINVGNHTGNDGNKNDLSSGNDSDLNNNTGNEGSSSSKDDNGLNGLLGVLGNNGNSSDNIVNNSNTDSHTGNNGNRDDLFSSDVSSFGKNSLNGNYEGIPNTGLFGGAIVGGMLSSSGKDSNSDGKINGKYEKYSFIFKLFNTIIPFVIFLVLAGIASGILSNAIFSTLLIGLILFNYYYINKLFNYWVEYYKNKYGNNGNPLFNDGESNQHKNNKKSDYVIFVSYIVSSFVIFILTILELLKSYWFILLLILLLIIIWLIVTDKDEVTNKKQDVFIKILYVISVLLSLVFTVILVVKEVIPWYWILFVILIFTILLTYLVVLKKLGKR